jgi:hypothetical protein
MANITEHHTEQEWERDSCVDRRVDFLVVRDSIG